MSGIFGIFGGGGRANDPLVPSTNPRIQTSVSGRPKTIGAGQNRTSGNVIWYDDYTAIATTEGGKGGAFAGGKGSPTGYTYSSSFIVGIGEEIEAVATIINGNQFSFLEAPSAEVLAALESIGLEPTYDDTFGATFFLGTYAQTAWSYLVTAHPDAALAYRGDSYAAFANLNLDTSPTLPNFNFELRWPINSDVPALGPDANPADWIEACLTNTDWGIGFPAALLGTMLVYRAWCRANSLVISPVLDSQTALASHLMDVTRGTIAEFGWRNGKLDVVPYADQSVTANGYTVTSNAAPVYDFIASDFLEAPNSPGEESSPVNVERRDPNLVNNAVRLQFLNRNTMYNPDTIYNQNDPQVVALGRVRCSDTKNYDFFCLEEAASNATALLLRREAVMQTFYFRVGPQFILMEEMDVVTLTEERLGLVRQAVRIREIEEVIEDGARSLAVTAEEYLGEVGPARQRRQAPLGLGRNINQAPGDVNLPIIFEPTAALAGGLEVWIAVSGVDQDIWGGCNIWACSEADGTYQKIATVQGDARMGVTTASLATIAEAPSGQTVDNTNTLSVSLVESEGELTSGSATDMTALNTRCYVGGEIIAYQNAVLTGTNAYNLSPMVRGAYGSTIGAHASGSDFVRLDNQMVRYPFTPDRVGGQLYLKFQSFNVYGGGLQDLADIGSQVYQIQGTALSTPLPDVTDLRWSYQDKTSSLTWSEVDDFRTPDYEIRLGDSWDAGIVVGAIQAHPPFYTIGDGTYWVKARAEPAPGLIVYSENAVSVTIAGSVIPDYLVAEYDQAALGWPGTITGPGAIVAGNFETTATGTIAYYEPPVAHIFNVGYDRPTRLVSSFSVVGVPLEADILSETDFLGIADLLGSASTQYVNGWVEISIGTATGDIYAPVDIYALPDIYGGGTGEWQRFASGQYLGTSFRQRLAIITYDEGTVATAIAYTIQCYVETRADHWTNYALGAPGATLTFRPDGGTADVPFKGGPNAATVPQIFVAIQNQSNGDYFTITGVTLSQFTVRCFNAGIGVARTVNMVAEGW